MPPQRPYQPSSIGRKAAIRVLIGTFVVLFLIVAAIIGSALANQGSNTQPRVTPHAQATQPASQPTTVPTSQPTNAPTQAPTMQPTPIPSAHELDQLLSSHDGYVLAVSTPRTSSDGTQNVAVDVQVNSPTQTRVKHLCYELASFFFQRTDIGLINIAFHASGYTGMDDPIADCSGLAPSGWESMSEDQLWTALTGVFNADLPT
jgi:hypothetical protein